MFLFSGVGLSDMVDCQSDDIGTGGTKGEEGIETTSYMLLVNMSLIWAFQGRKWVNDAEELKEVRGSDVGSSCGAVQRISDIIKESR